jgi:hypothetical protein
MTLNDLRDKLVDLFQLKPGIDVLVHALTLEFTGLEGCYRCKQCNINLLNAHLIDWWAYQVNELKVIPGITYFFPL